MKKLVHPQEVEVFYLLPALRRDLALCLKEQGSDQKEIAKILGVSEPSVSHYFNAKRGADVIFSDYIKEEVRKAAPHIKNSHDVIQETQKLLKMMHAEKEICKVCHGINKTNIPKTCRVCFD